jgi:hypothetical protein
LNLEGGLLVRIALVSILTATGAVTLALAQGAPPDKKGMPNPEAGMSDTQREAIHAETHAQNDRFLADFIAQHRDPHTLPVTWVQTYAAPPAGLQDAIRSADVIVHGRVEAVTFERNPSGGMPISTADIRVLDSVKGQAAHLISIDQAGGPVAAEGGRLAQFDMSQLVLAGDEVVLFLQQSALGAPRFQTVYGAGVYLVENGKIAGEAAIRFGVSGQPVPHFLARLSSTS